MQIYVPNNHAIWQCLFCCLLSLPPLGQCLLDQPQKPLVLPDVLPGASYNLDQQCELAFGEGSKPCPFMQPPCGRLWCTGKSNGHLVCMTRHFPWADGTHCGDEKVCDQGICSGKQPLNVKVSVKQGAYFPELWLKKVIVYILQLTACFQVDGRWGKWGQFGSCSRTCGGGVQLSKRECNNPVPSNGGKYCQGVRVKYRSCNLNHCPDTGTSFQNRQLCPITFFPASAFPCLTFCTSHPSTLCRQNYSWGAVWDQWPKLQ